MSTFWPLGRSKGLAAGTLIAGAMTLTGCAVADGVTSVADRMSEPFMSLLTGEELGDVSTDPQYSRRPEPDTSTEFRPFETGLGQPLAVIRFDSPLATYNQPLALAVGQALETDPGMKFDIVSVSRPNPALSSMANADRALANAATVRDDLIRHGVAADNIQLSVMSDPAVMSDGEVHIYVR